MKNAVIRTILVVAMAASASGQTTECANVTRSGGEVMMAADSIRVVDSIANTLAQEFSVVVSAEEPQYQFSEDLQDVREADPDWSTQHPNAHYLPSGKHTVDGGREASLEIVRPVSASGSKLWV